MGWPELLLAFGWFFVLIINSIVLYYIGVGLRGGREARGLMLISLVIGLILNIMITIIMLGAPWWLIGITALFLVVSVLIYLDTVYEDRPGSANKQ